MAIERLENSRWGFGSNCFVCEPSNARGMQVPFSHDGDRALVFADFTLGSEFSGAPTYVHGGATLALIDEGMSWATIALSEKFAFTKETSATFDWPVRVDRPYRLEVHIVDEDERRIVTEAVVVDAKQRPCVTARAEMSVLSPAQAVDAIGAEPGEDDRRYLR
ncbi:MAG TPA: PaaI family thioesterase [Acidimicrobiia bacterium]|nr:PaaI family thioesterase [Acidimicrobiia bacterium]